MALRFFSESCWLSECSILANLSRKPPLPVVCECRLLLGVKASEALRPAAAAGRYFPPLPICTHTVEARRWTRPLSLGCCRVGRYCCSDTFSTLGLRIVPEPLVGAPRIEVVIKPSELQERMTILPNGVENELASHNVMKQCTTTQTRTWPASTQKGLISGILAQELRLEEEFHAFPFPLELHRGIPAFPFPLELH
jgi:hypothetical protein